MSNWSVSYNEDKGAMQIVYDITNLFLNPVIEPELLPQKLIDDFNFSTFGDIYRMFTDNYLEILEQNTPLIVCIAFGFLFALLRWDIEIFTTKEFLSWSR